MHRYNFGGPPKYKMSDFQKQITQIQAQHPNLVLDIDSTVFPHSLSHSLREALISYSLPDSPVCPPMAQFGPV